MPIPRISDGFLQPLVLLLACSTILYYGRDRITGTPLKIEASGTCTKKHTADLAQLRLAAVAEGDSQERVASQVRVAANRAREILSNGNTASLAMEINQGSLSSELWEPTDRYGQTLSRKFRARISFEVLFDDFEGLSAVANELLTTTDVRIEGVEWSLKEATRDRLSVEVQQAAVRDAMQKAASYAGVLERGIVVTKVRELEHYHRSGAHFLRAASPQQGETFAMEPAKVEVQSNVEVTCEGRGRPSYIQ